MRFAFSPDYSDLQRVAYRSATTKFGVQRWVKEKSQTKATLKTCCCPRANDVLRLASKILGR